LLHILSRNDTSVLGDGASNWRRAGRALALVMKRQPLPTGEIERWEWVRNPLPTAAEHLDFVLLRRELGVPDGIVAVPGAMFAKLRPPTVQRLNRLFPRLIYDHNPFIRRIIRRTRQQLETQIDPTTNEPLLKRIEVELLGENEADAIILPPYLRDAYQRAEEFCRLLAARLQGAGFLKTLLLRRIGSTMYAGMCTAQRMLSDWEHIDADDDEDELALEPDDVLPAARMNATKTLTPQECELLQRVIEALEANKERDPKVGVVLEYLHRHGWLDMGCIVFSQYRDSVLWLAQQLTQELPNEAIGLYSGPTSSGLMLGGKWTSAPREKLKQMVQRGELRLLLGTDAASEGLNLQRLARLINLDLPWNPTRLEQRKGRIQRIGQLHDKVEIYNMRYKDSVEDRVHDLLSVRLKSIYELFGQVPDVLEDAWVSVALGEQAEAQRVIDAVPKVHPFDLRYTQVEPIDWEACQQVLDAQEKRRVLSEGW
jgi:hypothetical protein